MTKLDELHSEYETLIAKHGAKHTKRGDKALNEYVRLAKEQTRLDEEWRELQERLQQVNKLKRDAKSRLFDVSAELVRCFGRGPLPIEGVTHHFGETVDGRVYVYNHLPRTKAGG